MKNWKPYYRFIALPIVGIVTSIIFELLVVGGPLFLTGTYWALALFFLGALFGLFIGLLFAGIGAAIGRKVNAKYSESAGLLIGGFLGAVLGGVGGYYSLWFAFIFFIFGL